MSPSSPPVRRIVARDDELRDVVTAAARAARVAVDVEASGMFAYRARPCTVQLAWDDGGQVAVVDTLATSIAPLGELLGPGGPVKIVHDVAFDARLLAESGIALANVHDTAVAARMLSASGDRSGHPPRRRARRSHRQGDAAARLAPETARRSHARIPRRRRRAPRGARAEALDRGGRARNRGRRARGDALSHCLRDRRRPSPPRWCRPTPA